MGTVTSETTTPVWRTVDDFVRAHDWARSGTLRHILLYREHNGFAGCVVNVGRRVLIDEAKAIEWFRVRGDRPTADPMPAHALPSAAPARRRRKAAP